MTPGPFLPADIRRRRGARSRQEVLMEDRPAAEALFRCTLIWEFADPGLGLRRRGVLTRALAELEHARGKGLS